MKIKYFLASVIITMTITTGALLMPFAEYNSSRYMTDEMQKMSEISFNEDAVTVGLFGEKVTVKTDILTTVSKTITPFLPNEIKLSVKIIQTLAKYIGEAQ